MVRRGRIVFWFFTGALALHLAMSWLAHRAGDVYKQGVFMVGERKRNWAREKNSFQKDKLSVVFLGNSIQLAGLKPDVFDAALKGKTESFNLALPALPIGPGYFAVKEMTESWGRPDVIVVRLVGDSGKEPGLFDYNAIQGMGFPGEFLSYLLHRQNKIFALNYLVPLRMYTNETFRYLKDLVFDPAHIEKTRLRNAAVLEQLVRDRGWYYVEQQKIFEDGKLPDNYELATSTAALAPIPPGNFDWASDPYLRKFFDFALANNIQVLLVGSVFRSGTSGLYSGKSAAFVEIPKAYPNVRVSSDSWQNKLLPNRFFSDKTHLNPDGAKVYSEMIARDFAEAFEAELRP